MRPEEAARVGALDNSALSAAIERQSHSILGKITMGSERGLFPLTGLTARAVAGDRIALVGEAAHVIPPIGAQGFNLGLRDAATIGELVVDAWRDRGDIGSHAVLRRYEERRRADIGRRTVAVDLLNRSLLADLPPLQGLRGLGLHLLDRSPSLRRAMMREGVAPRTSEPQLMRGQPL
jgi:2-octaprenyl-6-methoxyphenol hydroxylase